MTNEPTTLSALPDGGGLFMSALDCCAVRSCVPVYERIGRHLPELRKRSFHFPLALAPETARSNLAIRSVAPLLWCYRGPGDERPHFGRVPGHWGFT
jgi:hypothetical protein